jgi:hypothetical protein
MDETAKFLSVLTESQDIYYHDTSISSAHSIIYKNTFELSPGLLKGSDARFHNLERPYFMSLSRVKSSRFRRSTNCTLVLDGRKLGAKHKIVPVDYWGPMFKKQGESEAEDRLLSSEPVLHDANDYIMEVHMKADEKDLEKEWLQSFLGFLQYFKDLPVWIYDDWKNLTLLNTARATNLKDIDTENMLGGDAKGSTVSLSRDEAFIEFLETGKPRGKKNQHVRRRLDYPRDFVLGGETDLHNLYSARGGHARSLIGRVIKMMREDGTQDVRDFLKKRWERMTGREFPAYEQV